MNMKKMMTSLLAAAAMMGMTTACSSDDPLGSSGSTVINGNDNSGSAVAEVGTSQVMEVAALEPIARCQPLPLLLTRQRQSLLMWQLRSIRKRAMHQVPTPSPLK